MVRVVDVDAADAKAALRPLLLPQAMWRWTRSQERVGGGGSGGGRGGTFSDVPTAALHPRYLAPSCWCWCWGLLVLVPVPSTARSCRCLPARTHAHANSNRNSPSSPSPSPPASQPASRVQQSTSTAPLPARRHGATAGCTPTRLRDERRAAGLGGRQRGRHRRSPGCESAGGRRGRAFGPLFWRASTSASADDAH